MVDRAQLLRGGGVLLLGAAACYRPLELELAPLLAPPNARSALYLIGEVEPQGLVLTGDSFVARAVAVTAGEALPISLPLTLRSDAEYAAYALFFACPLDQVGGSGLPVHATADGVPLPSTAAIARLELQAGARWSALPTPEPWLRALRVPPPAGAPGCTEFQPEEAVRIGISSQYQTLAFRDLLVLGPNRVLVMFLGYRPAPQESRGLLFDVALGADHTQGTETASIGGGLEGHSLTRLEDEVWMVATPTSGPPRRPLIVLRSRLDPLRFTRDATIPAELWGTAAISATISGSRPRLLLTTDYGGLWERAAGGWQAVASADPPDLSLPGDGKAQILWESPSRALIIGPGPRYRDGDEVHHTSVYALEDDTLTALTGQSASCVFWPFSLARQPRRGYGLALGETCVFRLQGSTFEALGFRTGDYGPNAFPFDDGFLVGVGRRRVAQLFLERDPVDQPECDLPLGTATVRLAALDTERFVGLSSTEPSASNTLQVYRAKPPRRCALPALEAR